MISSKILDSLIEDVLPKSDFNVFESHDERQHFFRDKTILVTGAGGFIGQELIKQLISCSPACLLACDQSEMGLHQLQNYIESLGDIEPKVHLVLGSVANLGFLRSLCATEHPQIIIHAAAYKHVSLVEKNLGVAYANNLLSVWNVLEVSAEYQVAHCLLVSSDKAKDPCSAMGHSKYLAELLLRYRALACGSTDFKIVRFGNVLGSTGSLLPKLLEQLSNGWDVTVTDPKATRYFMSLSEAVELTLHAMQLSEPGDIFSLDMGEPEVIGPLVERFINAYRHKIDPTVKVNIREIGLYDGERLHEPCLIDENSVRTSYPKIYTSQSALPFKEAIFWDHWDNLLRQLQSEPFDPNALIHFIDK